MSPDYRNQEAKLNTLLDFIQARIAWIARTEARAAWLGGYGANGEFDDERSRWLDRVGHVLRALERIGGSPRYHPVG